MQPAQGSAGFTDATRARLEAAIRSIMASFDLPGLALGIVRDGALVYARGFGVKNSETREPVTPTTLFHLASISKTFVATAVMQRVAQGKIDLQAPLVTYLPYFTMADERYRAITVGQMLSHLSGMPDVYDYQWESPEYDDGALERHVRGLASERLRHAPGQEYAYSNVAYEVLGDVVAKVSGRTFESYVDEQILRPLAMDTSTFMKDRVAPELGATPHLFMPHLAVSPIYPYHRAHAPSSTLHSNVLELGNWALANLARGSFRGTPILPAALHDLMLSEHHRLDDNIWEEAIGLAWFLGTYRGQRAVNHSGADVGFAADLILLPERSLGVILLINAIPAPTDQIMRLTLDLLLGHEPTVPLPPAIVPLGRTLAQRGMDAAIEQGRQLQRAHAADYDFGRFVRTADWLVWAKRYAEAIAVLALGSAVDPELADVHGALVAVYRSGVTGRTIDAMRAALALDRDNADAKALLRHLLGS